MFSAQDVDKKGWSHNSKNPARGTNYASVAYHEWRLKLLLPHVSSCSLVAPSSPQALMNRPFHSASEILYGVTPCLCSLGTDTNKGNAHGSKRKWRHCPVKKQPLVLDADKATRRIVKYHQPKETNVILNNV